MPKHLHMFRCPCCHKQLELDTRSGKARAVDPKEKHGGQDLDDLLAEQDKQAAKLDDVFQQGLKEQKRRSDNLDDLFKQASEDAQDDEGPLQRPFDLD